MESDMEAGQSLPEEEESLATLPSTGGISHEDHDRMNLHAQDLEIPAAPDQILDDESTSTDPAHHVLNINEQQYSSTELQLLQRKNIAQIVKEKNFQEFTNLGGVEKIAKALNCDLTDGLISGSQESVGQKIPSKFAASLFTSFLGVWKTDTIFHLQLFAALSLTVGIMQRGFNMMGCRDGAVVLLAVIILVIIGTTYNFIWDKRSQKKLDGFSVWGKMKVPVVRAGRSMVLDAATDLQVGDLALLRKGGRVPADGIFAHSVQALELEGINNNIDEHNPFLFFGSRVINGNVRMIVTSVGVDTVWGEMMIQAMKKKSTLETMLHKLDKKIQILGISMTVLAHLLRTLTGAKNSTSLLNTILEVIQTLSTGSIFVGLLRGLPSFISVVISTWNHKTLAGKATVRDHLSCVKIAPVTTILCTDRFGGLNEAEKEIDKIFLGGDFVCESSTVASNVLEDLCDGIGTLLLVPRSGRESMLMQVVSSWAEATLGMKNVLESKRCKITRSSGHNPFQECCKVQIEKRNEGKKFLHFSGPPRDILTLCSKYYSIEGNAQPINAESRMKFEQTAGNMLAEGEAMGFACGWLSDSDEPSAEDENCGLIFLGMIGLKNKNIEETKRQIATLKEGGIRIILTSGDDVPVLEKVAQKYELLDLESEVHDLVVTGEEFRAWSDEERTHKLEKISIIGNCLPSDKILLIKHLQEKGEVVAMLGQRTADAPALKQADTGLTFGTWSSEVARDCCDINLGDGGFKVLADVIVNGRCLYENIQKFIQLNLNLIIPTTLVNFFTTILSGDAALTAIESFWLNLIVPCVGGLASLTLPETENLMAKPPVRYSSAKLLNSDMLRNIAIQVVCQTGLLVTFQRIGPAVLGESESGVKSAVFNGLFIYQIFNMFMARMPEKKNIFRGLINRGHKWFWSALVFLLLCHGVFLMIKSVYFDSPWPSLSLCGVCLLFSFICWLLDFAGKSVSSFIDF